MDKQTFCSSQTTSNTSRYAAALYRQGTHAGHPWLPWLVRAEWVGGKQNGGWDRKRTPRMLDTHRGQTGCRNDRLSGEWNLATSRDF